MIARHTRRLYCFTLQFDSTDESMRGNLQNIFCCFPRFIKFSISVKAQTSTFFLFNVLTVFVDVFVAEAKDLNFIDAFLSNFFFKKSYK